LGRRAALVSEGVGRRGWGLPEVTRSQGLEDMMRERRKRKKGDKGDTKSTK